MNRTLARPVLFPRFGLEPVAVSALGGLCWRPMAQAASAGSLIGRIISEKYEVRRLLGAGATSAVYEAWHQYTDRLVALKVLHEHYVGNRAVVRRFMREVRALSGLHHPAIVMVLDAGVTETDQPYMVQELLQGRDLDLAFGARDLTVSDLIDIGGQLLDALAAAHERNIVHRDVKPQNVFLLEGPAGGVQVKLVDFGVAKTRHSVEATSALTLPGLTVGTPYYMSPEQARGDTVGPQTDVFAVGCVLFQGAVGKPPFDRDGSLGDLLMQIVTTRAPLLRDIRPELPESLIAAVDGALEPDPSARWPSAAAMAACLRRTAASVKGLDWDDD